MKMHGSYSWNKEGKKSTDTTLEVYHITDFLPLFEGEALTESGD